MDEQYNWNNSTSTSGMDQQSPSGNPKATISMILGIVSLVLPCLCCFVNSFTFVCVLCVVDIICAIAAIVMSVISKKDGPSGQATAGLVCGIIGLVLGILYLGVLVLAIIGLSAMGLNPFELNEMSPQELESYLNNWLEMME